MDAFRDALGPDVDDLVDEAIETGDIGDPGELERLASLLAAGLRDAAYAADQMRAGNGLAWPPGRNDACWCESGRKYKRCCGTVTETVLHPLDANAGG